MTTNGSLLRAVQVFAASVECLCHLQAMLVENAEREQQGLAPAYSGQMLRDLPTVFVCNAKAVRDILYPGV